MAVDRPFRVEWHGVHKGDVWKLLFETADFGAADARASEMRKRIGGRCRVVVAQTVKTYR